MPEDVETGKEREREIGGIYSLFISQSVTAEDHSSWQVALTPAVGLAVEEKVQAEEGKNGFQNGGYLRAIYGHEGRWWCFGL